MRRHRHFPSHKEQSGHHLAGAGDRVNSHIERSGFRGFQRDRPGMGGKHGHVLKAAVSSDRQTLFVTETVPVHLAVFHDRQRFAGDARGGDSAPPVERVGKRAVRGCFRLRRNPVCGMGEISVHGHHVRVRSRQIQAQAVQPVVLSEYPFVSKRPQIIFHPCRRFLLQFVQEFAHGSASCAVPDIIGRKERHIVQTGD